MSALVVAINKNIRKVRKPGFYIKSIVNFITGRLQNKTNQSLIPVIRG
jgi:biotin operon repressor